MSRRRLKRRTDPKAMYPVSILIPAEPTSSPMETQVRQRIEQNGSTVASMTLTIPILLPLAPSSRFHNAVWH